MIFASIYASVFSDTCLLQLFVYYSLKKQNFGSRMDALKFSLIVSFYRFVIEKCDCTADKRLN